MPPMRRLRTRRSGAFTLVEILIVVVILGILAAIVVPQFSSATEQAEKTSTFDQLQKLRAAISVYYVRNSNTYPNITAGNGTWGPLIGTGADYLRDPPRNTYVGGAGASVIALDTAPDSTFQLAHGWIYNPATGDLWAGNFDAAGNPIPRP